MKPEITEGDPFLNQPDLLCTIIRPLSAFEYDPNNGKAGAEKYCLLDICLQDENNSTGVLNIGDEAASVNVTYQLIKVFETVEEAKAYALKYAIQDVAF